MVRRERRKQIKKRIIIEFIRKDEPKDKAYAKGTSFLKINTLR